MDGGTGEVDNNPLTMFDLGITHSPVYGLPKPCLSVSLPHSLMLFIQ